MPATIPARSPRLAIEASDVSGQKRFVAQDVPSDTTVAELVDGLLAPMDLPRVDPDGETIVYHARLEREARHLIANEVVGDALQDQDRIVVQPRISAAGSTARRLRARRLDAGCGAR